MATIFTKYHEKSHSYAEERLKGLQGIRFGKENQGIRFT